MIRVYLNQGKVRINPGLAARPVSHTRGLGETLADRCLKTRRKP